MDSYASRDYAVTALCLGVAGIVLGLAMYLSGGFYNIPALQLTTVAYVLCVLAVALRRIRRVEDVARHITPFVLAAGLVWQLYRLGADAAYAWPIAGVAIAVVAALTLRQSTLSVWWVTLGLVLALIVPHFLVGLWAIRGLANPDFDVYYCHMQSLEALVKGINPHTLTIAYVHPDELKYPASYVLDGRVHIGFPYPPLSLFMALPGYLVGGD